jgi:hypothetical protein
LLRPRGDEALLLDGVGILTGEGEVVFQNRDQLREAHAMGPEVRIRLPAARQRSSAPIEQKAWLRIFEAGA